MGRTNLWESLRSVALVWLHSLAIDNLAVLVSRVDDPIDKKTHPRSAKRTQASNIPDRDHSLSIPHNTQRLKLLSRTKLVGPGASNTEVSARHRVVRSTSSRVASDLVRALGGSGSIIGVDAKAVVAGLGVGSAGALEVLDRPGGASGGHHADADCWLRDGGCQRSAGGGQEGEDGGGELHDDVGLLEWVENRLE